MVESWFVREYLGLRLVLAKGPLLGGRRGRDEVLLRMVRESICSFIMPIGNQRGGRIITLLLF